MVVELHGMCGGPNLTCVICDPLKKNLLNVCQIDQFDRKQDVLAMP